MGYMYERIAYLKGLAEGLEIEGSREGKVLVEMIDMLEDMAILMEEIDEDSAKLEDYVSFIDEDLADLEDDFYDYEDFDGEIMIDDIECSCCDEHDCDEEY